MSILGLIAADGGGAPFSATVGPIALFRSKGIGINITNAFVATPAGTGPYTYLWSGAYPIAPNTPAASSCSYTIDTDAALVGPNILTCTVTDTATGQTFVAEFSIIMVQGGGRLDQNEQLV